MSKMEQHLDATLEQILELARWAPSGDNTQPWRFEILDARRLIVHGHDTRDHCVYDLDGHPSQISLGALLETMAIAASTFGLA
ncbi:MAG TPA: nitroreductase family protein, partial [Duganella sp.]|nr:nitroreductase family protein [Duganella sp.]